MHLSPGRSDGHFNVLRGVVGDYAGVKVVGDFVDNYKSGLPSEMALLNLFDPVNGTPKAVIDAAGITDMRTGAVTAIGAKLLAPEKPRVLGHIGARGTAYWNVRLLDHLFDFEEIRVHSHTSPGFFPVALAEAIALALISSLFDMGITLDPSVACSIWLRVPKLCPTI